MSEFLWEIGCEEIPARMLPEAVEQFRLNMAKALGEARLTFESIESHGTPRRLMVAVGGLADRQPEGVEERRGPPVSSAFDKDGRPSKAAEGFARSCGVTVGELRKVNTPKGEYLSYTLRTDGRPAVLVLPDIMTTLLGAFPWPKAMRWGAGAFRFVRPLHTICALLDGALLPFDNGEGVFNDDRVAGHRFMAPGPHRVSSLAEYKELLPGQFVILSIAERQRIIRKGVERLAKEAGGKAVLDEGLVTETACLVEWPVPLLGRFPEEYLELPPEVLTTSMKHHQKYFPVVDGKGRPMACFVAIANMVVPDPGVLVKGYARVLRARLEDAAFYWQEDRKRTLEERLAGLKGVVFQARLGTLYDKSMRMVALGVDLARRVDPALVGVVEPAARLAKCDLVTGMVGEFPELQGIMGSYYARHDGLDQRVAEAIREHYQPQGAGDSLPNSLGGVCLSLADKLDTLVGCFGIGLTPTGNKDPFGLRRAALGVIRMVLNGAGLRLPLREVLGQAHRHYAAGVLERHEEQTVEGLLEFFYGRLQAHLKAEGLDYDLIDAVQALGHDDLWDAVRRVRALAAFKSLPSYASLVAANKRIANILTKSGGELGARPRVDPELLSEPAERGLHAALVKHGGAVTRACEGGEYGEALTTLAGLREVIDRFFDDVLVMAEEQALRRNRLALLHQVRAAFHQVADVSRLVLPEA